MKKSVMIVSAILVLTLPWTARLFEPETVLSIAVVDVSSSNDSYMERAGIYDVLHFEKIVNEEEKQYSASEHYYGVKVDTQKTDISYESLPLRMDAYDLIYVADTAGIKEQDLQWTDDAADKLLYSGLTNTMWRTLQSRFTQPEPVTFIAEHQIFSRSTEKEIQQQVAEHLQIKNSGWRAKYFDDVKDANINLQQASGSGFVFVHNETKESLFIASKTPAVVKMTTEGEKLFEDAATSAPYNGWFDISTADGTMELAIFDVSLSREEQQQLETKGIPTTWTAITKNTVNQATNYYFAGDFSHRTKEPLPLPLFLGYETINKWLAKEDAFYWEIYEPVFAMILQSVQHQDDEPVKPVVVEPLNEEGLSYNARIVGERYEVLKNGSWQPLTIKGVNIGMAKPGLFPGEAGIEKADYKNWLESIGEMGSNAIRIYTIHPPSFYEALLEYNESHEQPIYLFHGVWIEEELLTEQLDVYGEPTELFQSEIKRVVDLIHGNATLEPRPGHASGTYTANVAPYVIGWMLGIEWYPYTVQGTNDKHDGKQQLTGEFFETKNANPFEIWLAEQFEFTAQYEAEKYNWMRPFSFTNWVTTDLLEHPYEPDPDEDLVSVDPNVIYEKNAYEQVGQFAAYHVYPYYPDFFNYTPNYLQFKDHRGEPNSYAAYLKDLHAAHRLPILISEFGIPASRGMTHKNPFGWNQGFMAEDEQGEILVRLLDDILHENMLGGLVFSWQDEWFKRTWNTMDLDNPDQRPYWSNAQTNEQQFGLLSFDRLTHQVDGDTSDWFGEQPFLEDNAFKLFLNSDERYLYMRLDIEDTNFTDDYYPLISFDTLKSQGNESYRDIPLQQAADFVLTLKGEQSRIEVDAYYDLFQKIYGQQLNMVPFAGKTTKNSGQFNTIDFALSKELYIPIVNESHPFEKYETGKLRRGNGNPSSLDYDSLADYDINEKEGIVEIRIPWLMLNITDPSRREVWDDIYANEKMAYTIIDGIGIEVQLVENNKTIKTLPTSDEVKLYSWETWEMPRYKERLKESYYILQKRFREIE